MTTLVSFLGKSRHGSHAGYQKATYALEGGPLAQTTFLGSLLMERLQPQRTLLLGTAGSMWDALEFDLDTPEWAELGEAAEHARVDQALLDRVQHRARRSMQGAELVLIPSARNEAEQMRLLTELAERIEPGERVILDITHSYRHLPLLALVAARYLAHVRQAMVTDIYYGALEMMENGITPVLKLDGLLRMLDWVEALAAHDASGDYGRFAPLLQADGLSAPVAESLRQAAHMERVTNSAGARAKLLPLLNDLPALGGATSLFAGQLAQRLGWVRRNSRGAREMALHEAYLARRDFLRAVIYLQEAAISAECDRLRLGHNVHEHREQARRNLKVSRAFRDLSDIRNMLAHGTLGGDDPRTQQALQATGSAPALAQRLAGLRMELTQDLGLKSL